MSVCPLWVDSGHSTNSAVAAVSNVRFGWKADIGNDRNPTARNENGDLMAAVSMLE